MNGPQALYLLLTLIVSGVGAYIGSYLREKGKALATKEDIGKITGIVEEVKAEVSHRDWTRREWKNLRRIKLEEMLSAVHEYVQFVEACETAVLKVEIFERPNPSDRLQSITHLYFPELRDVVLAFLVCGFERTKNASKFAPRFQDAKFQGGYELVYAEYAAGRDMMKLKLAKQRLDEESRQVLNRIMEIDDK